ncbi:MAG: hypothetical protein ABII22_03280 [Candidatus Micrarchaeota archaeon]
MSFEKVPEKGLIRDIKRYKIISAFFLIALVFFFSSLLLDGETMKYAAIVIIILGGISVRMTWVQPSFISEQTNLTNVSIATSYSFLFLGFMLGLVFLMDSFGIKIENMTFTIFGCVLLSIIAASVYLAYKMKYYL